ncbi:MAG: ABC transporter ATP-binding protein [Verrucomicrobiales bacterium]|nr:ABC transporter ATP-binding protein [Verrucomicrobiales bacterium]
MRVQIQQISKRFGTTPVLQRVSFDIESHELFFLLGPSGCGKTTLLRLVAGFYQPDSGELRFGDRLMNGVEPHRRNTGMVFQNYALWPHLSVAENVGYGLDVRGVTAAERAQRIDEALRTVRMETLAQRTPNQLSGGQQQRVALARALVIRPDLLLLDEPLSNLDARLRLEMRDEIRRIHQETRITTLYVTHDQKEALSMADRMAVMRDGVVEQIGCPRDVYRAPANRFVADFIGEANWLDATVVEANATATVLQTPVGPLIAPPASAPVVPGHRVQVGFRPESARLTAAPENTFTGTLESVTYLGDSEQVVLRLQDGSRIKAAESDPLLPRVLESQVSLHVPRQSLFVLPASAQDAGPTA